MDSRYTLEVEVESIGLSEGFGFESKEWEDSRMAYLDEATRKMMGLLS